jgi:ferredoxin-fold anticodon binding domain-containing protein
MNPGAFAAIFIVLIVTAQNNRRRRLLAVLRHAIVKGVSMDMKMIQNLLGKKIKARCIDSALSPEIGTVEQVEGSWILLKDPKGREKILKAEYIAKIEILP